MDIAHFKSRLAQSLVVIAALSWLGCGKSNPTGPPLFDELIPLSVGNTWVWQHYTVDSTGAVVYVSKDSEWVQQDSLIGGTTYYLMVEQSKYLDGTPVQSPSSYLATNTSSGFAIWNGDRNEIVLDYPYVPGDTSVLQTNVRITVPAGTFTCLEYRTPEGSYYFDNQLRTLYGQMYVSPRTGMVRRDFAGTRQVLTQVIIH